MEKLPAEKPIEEKVQQVLEEAQKPTGHWEIDEANGIKTCSACSRELHGWAFRQEFKFCPFCGSQNLS